MTFIHLNVLYANFEPFKQPVLDEDGRPAEGYSHLVVVNTDDIVCAGIPDPESGGFLHVYLRDGKHLVCWGGIDQLDPVETLEQQSEG